MNTRRFILSTALLGAASLLPVGSAFSQTATATTDPVGYTTSSFLASSDTITSIPFTRPVAFTGLISSINGNVITLAGSPGFTASQFVYAAGTQTNTYYAIVGPLNAALTGTVTATNGSKTLTGSGTSFGTQGVAGDALTINGIVYTIASVQSTTSLTLDKVYAGTTASGLSATYDHSPKEGSFYTVTANDAGSVTVNLNGDSLSTVAANTSVSLIPYWTIGTAFPATDANVSYVPSASLKSRATQILLPDLSSAGTNLPSQVSFFYFNNAWRLAGGDSTVSYNDTILPIGTSFTIRNTTTATTFTPSGAVYMNRLSVPLPTQTNSAQDTAVAVSRPANTTLNDLGLISSGAFVASPSVKNRTDLLLTFDNTQSGINKPASNGYYFYNGAWRQAGADSTVDYGSTVIPYGSGLVVRKAATTNGATSFWQNARNY